ncbi:MAG: hypothetical protein WCA08_16985 [Desulfoferrobacter sp.]
MEWTVTVKKKVSKEIPKLPDSVKANLIALIREMEFGGPVRGNWQNYGKLFDGLHHCHLKKGKPCYVAVWEVKDKEIRLIEVCYVGTHEKAPY